MATKWRLTPSLKSLLKWNLKVFLLNWAALTYEHLVISLNRGCHVYVSGCLYVNLLGSVFVCA